MPMTIVITRDVEARYRGFLASAMLEVSPGVYVSPDLPAGVRERIWKVLQDWFRSLGKGRRRHALAGQNGGRWCSSSPPWRSPERDSRR